MPTQWIDFKDLKARVRIEDVLARYGYRASLTDKGDGKLVGPCPIHKGKNPGSFHVNTEKNIFNCFSSCGGGNVLDLVMKIEDCAIREAGQKLASWFELTFEKKPQAKQKEEAKAKEKETPAAAVRQESRQEEVINPPLQRPLASLNQDHPYLWVRELVVDTVKTFGLGFCTRGIMKERIAIPIHNEQGQLVAYAGRATTDELAGKDGKYKLPQGFQKSRVVWNLRRAREHGRNGLVVVEGFFDAMHVHQAGFPNVVALMGSALSDEQAQLLVDSTEKLALLFDGDDAGVNCAREFWKKVRHQVFMKEIKLKDGEQPDALAGHRIEKLLEGLKP